MIEFDVDENIEIACEWIEALAANEFPQAQCQLRKSTGRCCLGVLRDVAGGPEYDTDSYLYVDTVYGLLQDKSQQVLSRFNDVDELPHHKIAKRLIMGPDNYFVPEIAQGVKEYFWTGGT